MTQTARRAYLIAALRKELPQPSLWEIPGEEEAQKAILRALMNLRPPMPVTEEFLAVQDGYLQEEIKKKGVTDLSDLEPLQTGIYLWRGDITTLRCDGIVNAANRQMLGCFCPNHGCIDNAIHTFAGVQLRLACAELMKGQGHEEETGKAKITPAYNLPSRYVLHTVGPIVSGRPTLKEKAQLASCYRSCLELAEEKGLKSLAFCCISTGEFHFPNVQAAKIGIETVKQYKKRSHSEMQVIFNVYKELDETIYRGLLSADEQAER